MSDNELTVETSSEGRERPLPAGLDAVVFPGVPRVATPDVDEDPYPSSTIDVIKILRSEGVRVDYADPERPRVSVDLKAAEVWLPIVVFTSEALANGLGGVLTAAFLEMVGRARAGKTRLHARVGRIRSDDLEIEWLDVDGPADAALEAIERFFGDRDD
jgi:hypothetical protein